MNLERLSVWQGSEEMAEYILFDIDKKTDKPIFFDRSIPTIEKARSEAIKYISPAHRYISILSGTYKGRVFKDYNGKSGYFFDGKDGVKEIGLDGKFIVKKPTVEYRITSDVAGRNVVSRHKSLPLARASACKQLSRYHRDNDTLYIDAGEKGHFYASITYKKGKYGFDTLIYEDNKSTDFRELNEDGTFKRK